VRAVEALQAKEAHVGQELHEPGRKTGSAFGRDGARVVSPRMGRVVHFEVHADDPRRAVAFYTGVFGWQVNALPTGDYWLLTTGTDGDPGINGAVLPRMGERPAPGAPVMGASVTVAVDDLDDTLARALAAGASMALAKMTVPGVGDLAYILDTEANVLGVLQPSG
jgi:uncharacterized protein